jgi:hypothetical protein
MAMSAGGGLGPIRLWHVLALTVVLGVSLFVPLSVPTRAQEALLDMVHAPAFGALAVLTAAWVLGRREAAGKGAPAADALPGGAGDANAAAPLEAAPRRWSPGSIGLAVWLGVSLVGAASELIQGSIGRGRSLQDVVANCLGAGAFLTACFALRYRIGAARWGWMLAGCGLLFAAWLVPLADLVDSVVQVRELPRLADFERSGELQRWIPQHATLERAREHATAGAWGARVELQAAHFAGIVLRLNYMDWRGYERLDFDLYLPEELDSPLFVRLVDRAYDGSSPLDRFDRPLRLRRGSNHVSIPLANVLRSPQGREFDLGRVHWLALYATDTTRPMVFYLDNVRLTGGPGGESADWRRGPLDPHSLRACSIASARSSPSSSSSDRPKLPLSNPKSARSTWPSPLKSPQDQPPSPPKCALRTPKSARSTRPSRLASPMSVATANS